MNTKLIVNLSTLSTDHNYDNDIFFNVNQNTSRQVLRLLIEKKSNREKQLIQNKNLINNKSLSFRNALKLGTIINFSMDCISICF
jgi:hypothetical protein